VLDNPLAQSVTADMRNGVMKELTASKIVRRNQVDEMTTQDPNRYAWRVKHNPDRSKQQ
jgi:hypothetical protein